MQNCLVCGRKKWGKTTDKQMVDGHEVRVWVCVSANRNTGKICGHRQAEAAPFYENRLQPRVLYVDIERALGEFYGYDRKVPSKYINIKMLKEEPYIICYAAGWVKPDAEFQYIISDCVRQEEALAKDDRRVMESLWRLLDSADYVVGHNVRRFDNRKINERFILLGMPAPYEYKTIDTYTWSKAKFDFMSNGLDFIAPKLGGEPKQDVYLADWIDIVKTGNPETLLKAEMYCRSDVRNGITVYNAQVKYIESGGGKVYK